MSSSGHVSHVPERALLMRHDMNKCNESAVLREFRSRKKLRKGPLSLNGLKKMIKKFEETGSLTIRAGRGRKPVSKDVQLAAKLFEHLR